MAIVVLAALFVIGKLTANSEQYREKVTLIEQNRALREQVEELSARVAELERATAEPTEEPVEEPDDADTPNEE